MQQLQPSIFPHPDISIWVQTSIVSDPDSVWVQNRTFSWPWHFNQSRSKFILKTFIWQYCILLQSVASTSFCILMKSLCVLLSVFVCLPSLLLKSCQKRIWTKLFAVLVKSCCTKVTCCDGQIYTSTRDCCYVMLLKVWDQQFFFFLLSLSSYQDPYILDILQTLPFFEAYSFWERL